MASLLRVNILISLLFISISFSCSHSISEKEPDNDNRKLALKLEPKQKVSGSFYSSTGTDMDYVYVSVDTPALIKGQLSAVKGVDSEILFFRKGEAAPFKIINDNKSSLNERFGPYLISSPGVVIAIRPLQSLNDEKYAKLKYEFFYEIMTPPSSMEQETNDTIELANIIDGGSIKGFYNNALSGNDIEKDNYYIDIPETQKYRLTVNLSKVTGIDGVIRVYSKEGEKLLTVDNGVAGEEENIYSYGVQGPTRLFLSVNAKDYKINDSEYYELKAEVNPYEEKYELESNDSIREATPIKVNKIFGDFSNDQDIDYYRFYNETFDTVSFMAEVVPSSNYDIRLELYYGINVSPIVFDDGSDDVSEGIASWVLKPLETVYLKVNKKSLGRAGAYTLNTQFAPVSENQEREPNDSLRSATVFYTDKYINGYINPGKDQDYFKVKIPMQDKYSVELESPPECAMTVSILDVKGIKTEGKTASNPGENIELKAILDPDSFVLISCENSLKPMYKSPYRIHVIKYE